jgi:hypothetical protein
LSELVNMTTKIPRILSIGTVIRILRKKGNNESADRISEEITIGNVKAEE